MKISRRIRRHYSLINQRSTFDLSPLDNRRLKKHVLAMIDDRRHRIEPEESTFDTNHSVLISSLLLAR